MIDGIEILNLPANPANLHKLDWNISVNTNTGETAHKQTAFINGLFLAAYKSGRVILKGSLAKYNHGNNCKDLTLLELRKTVNELADTLGINPAETDLNGLEIGVNIELPYNPNEFLNSLIVWHRIEPLRWTGKNENYVQFGRSQTTLKIYSKSLQHDLSGNLLRYEFRIDRMAFAHKLGVKTLADLTAPDKWQSLANELLNTFNGLIYYDNSIDQTKLTAPERKLLEKGNNPYFWSKSTLNRSAINRNHKKFMALVNTHGKKRLNNIKNLIENKLITLKTCTVITDISEKKNEKTCNELTTPKKRNSQRNYTLNSGLKTNMYQNSKQVKKEPKKCKVTGLDISMQKDESVFLCTSGIKYYKTYEPEIYTDLKKRLSPKWENETEVVQIDEIHHSIRNEYFNLIHNTRRSINRVLSYPSLFENPEMFIRPDKRQYIV